MGKCLVERFNISLGNVPGYKRLDCVTGINVIDKNPPSTNMSEMLSIDVKWSTGINGSINAIGNCFFTDSYIDQPLSYFEDQANSAGTTFTGNSITKGKSNTDGGFFIEKKQNLTRLNVQLLEFDTADLLGMSSMEWLGLSNNNLEAVDFSKVLSYCSELKEFRVINGKATLDLSVFSNTPKLQLARLHSISTPNVYGTQSGVNINITGDIADMYVCPQLNQIDAYNTAVRGDFYTLIERYRTNERTSGNIKSQNIGNQDLKFNGVSIENKTNNIIVWDATHAYIAINTNQVSLSGKTKIYYIGYSAEEVAEMKQGLWSDLADANIINCGD